jgi:DNA-binding NarL/FixJ family response regulator
MKGKKETELTEREVEVLKLVAKGSSNKQVADDLCISVDTVKNHLKNIYKKLDVRNKIEAIRSAGLMKSSHDH